jgi:hypothetical protein
MSKRQRAKYKDFKKRWGLQKAKHITSTEQIRLIAPIPRRQYSTNLVETGMIILKNASVSFLTDFESVKQRQKIVKSNEGFVYIVTNTVWDGYVKIGRAIDPVSRVTHFNTYDPMRQFKLRYVKYFIDCKDAERTIHSVLLSNRVRGEWFNVSISIARNCLDALTDSVRI